jgi:hypothetical protein
VRQDERILVKQAQGRNVGQISVLDELNITVFTGDQLYMILAFEHLKRLFLRQAKFKA